MQSAVSSAGSDAEGSALSWRSLAAVTGLAAVVRLALLLRVAVLQPDGCYYLWIAGDLGRGDWPRALADSKPPLYPALIALAHALGVPLEAAGYAVSIALGSLAAAALAVAFRRATGSAAAALAGAALFAIQPESVRAGADVMSEATFFFFVAMALAAGLRALDDGALGAAAASGALGGLAYLTRPEGLAVPVALGIPIAWRLATRRVGLAAENAEHAETTPKRGEGTFAVSSAFFRRVRRLIFVFASGAGGRRPGLVLAAMLAGLLAVGGPYAIAISRADGKVEVTRKHAVAELTGLRAMPAVTPAADDLRAQVAGAPPAPHASAGASLAALARAVWRAISLLLDATHPLLAILAALGAFSLRERAGARRLGGVIALFVGLGVLLDWHMGYLDRRHLATAAALATGFSGAGALALRDWWVANAVHPRLVRVAPRVLAGIGFALAAAILLPKALARRFETHVGLREDGAWLRDYAGPGGLVLGLYATEVAYYAGAREVPMPYGSAADVIAAARARGVRFLVIGLRAQGEQPPDPRPEATLTAIGLRPFGRLTHYGPDGRVYYRLIYEL